jgi:hypothetical protein
LVSAENDCCTEYTVTSSAAFTIQDDDDWTVSSCVTDSIALEPCTWISSNERTGAFDITKSDGQDWTYNITVKFEMGGTAVPRNVGQSANYYLTTNSNGGVTEDMVTVSLQNGKWIGSVVIPANYESITLYVMPDSNNIFEDDGNVTLTIIDAYAVSGFSFNIGSDSGGEVTIWQAPEFISDTDKNVDTDSRPFSINGDTYYGYVSQNAKSDTKINTPISIYAENNRGVEYSIVSGNETGLFAIDSNSGEITTTVSLKDQTNLATSYSLQIKAKDPNSNQYDLATVPITLTQWQVSRNSASKAPAISVVGCTINELADEIGLQQNEFKEWLTFTADTVTLVDGTTISTNVLGSSDILAGGQQFQIPNTIYMAWFGEMGSAGQGWMSWGQNVADLQCLKFNVVTFNNDLYHNCAASAAKWDFVRGIEILAESKSLHGLYMMGHGASDTIGSSGTIAYTAGPDWSIPYGTIPQNPSNTSLSGSSSGDWTIGKALNYHLGALIIHACNSDGSAPHDLVSTNDGIFVGQTGTYYPIVGVERIAIHWGYGWESSLLANYTVYGGKQKTNKIYIPNISAM